MRSSRTMSRRALIVGAACCFLTLLSACAWSPPVTPPAPPPPQPAPHPRPAPAPCANGYVYLTFDDGPGPNTDALLNVLDAEHITATFFAVGKEINWYPAQWARLSASRHRIGWHTQTHPHLPTLSDAAVAQELTPSFATTIWRPPYGEYTPAIAASTPMKMVLWTDDPGDWTGESTDQILASFTEHVGPGSIVLLHELSTTLAAIPAMADVLRGRGLCAAPIGV